MAKPGYISGISLHVGRPPQWVLDPLSLAG